MKVKLNAPWAGPNGIFATGSVIDVTEDQGSHMIEYQYAVAVDSKGKVDTTPFFNAREVASFDSVVETAMKKKVARKPRAKPDVSE